MRKGIFVMIYHLVYLESVCVHTELEVTCSQFLYCLWYDDGIEVITYAMFSWDAFSSWEHPEDIFLAFYLFKNSFIRFLMENPDLPPY